MKIGILTASVSRSAGGTFEAVRNMAQELQHMPQVDVSVFGIRDEAFDADAASWGSVPIEVFSAAGPRSFGYAAGLYPALRHAAIDLLHVHGLWMYPSVAAQRWHRDTGRPGVISPHGMLDSWALANAGWKKRVASLLYEWRHLRQGACIHALCRAEVKAIREFGLRNPICVIPNGIDHTEASLAGAPVWRKELSATAKVLLYLGRLHRKKGLAALLRAWASAPRGHLETGKDWRLVIAGWDQDGHELELRQLASQLGIADSVHFVGPQFGMDKESTLQSADAFILPSLSEGLPMVVLEAWARNLPVLMTPACNLEEGFAAGAALSVDPEDASICRGLDELFSMSAEQRQAIGNAGRRLIFRQYGKDRVAADMHAVYSWLLGRASQPSCVQVM